MMKRFRGAASLFAFFIFLSFKTFGQPSAGDMVVLGIDVVNDKIMFATLVDIPAGTEIKITDRGWDNAANAFTPSMTGDGIVTWTPIVKVDAGSILSLVLGGADNAPATGLVNVTINTNLTSQAVFNGYSTNDALLASGDQVFIYRGSDTNPYFIFGLNASGNTNLDANNWQTAITQTLVHSTLPNGVGSQNSLTAGVNAVGVLTNPGGSTAAQQQFDNVFYNGPSGSADKATWLARITDKTNWDGDDSGAGSTSVGTTLGTSAIALPVAFGSINATGSDNKYTLSWQTASETNNSHFEVQASEDGAAFTTIATIESRAVNGNSDRLLEYSVTIALTGSMALSGLGIFALFIAATGKKRQWLGGIAVCIFSIIAWYGCSKNNQGVTIGKERVYIRIAQVDKDGGKSYSKVIVVHGDR